MGDGAWGHEEHKKTLGRSDLALFHHPLRGELVLSRRNKSPCLVLLTASAPTRGKGALTTIRICAVVVFEGFSVLIYLKVCDRALRVARGGEFGAPLDDKPRTSHLRSQPP